MVDADEFPTGGRPMTTPRPTKTTRPPAKGKITPRCGFAGALLLVSGFGAFAASFDCGKARTPDETAVCADSRLSALDEQFGHVFATAMKQPEAETRHQVRTVARDFLADRRKCGAESRCIVVSYLNALGFFRQFADKIDLPDWITAPLLSGGRMPDTSKLPRGVGECVSTVVKEIGPRLEGGNFDSGTSISFTNTGYQVSYEREQKLLASRLGDKAVMCLASIPRFCPQGDDRGRLYLVTNLRTGTTWWLSDSEHGCGGA